MLNLPGHNRAPHAFALKSFNQLRKLAQRKPVNRSRAVRFDLRESFLLDRNDDHFVSRRASRIQHEQGKRTVASDKPNTHKQWSLANGQWSEPDLTGH